MLFSNNKKKTWNVLKIVRAAARQSVRVMVFLLIINYPLSLLAIPTSNLRHLLREDEVLIEIHTSLQSDSIIDYYASTLRNNYSEPQCVFLFDEEELDSVLSKGYAVFSDTTIARMLLQPLGQELLGVKRILFVPTGKLAQIPIEYCNVDGGQMISEKYEFFRLSSASVLTNRNHTRKQYKTYIIYGGIDFDFPPDFEEIFDSEPIKCQYGYLKDSYCAAEDIHTYLHKKGLKGMMYSNEMATESSLKSLPWKDVQIFFIETHGVVTPNETHGKKYPDALMMAGASYVMAGGIIPEGEEDGLLTSNEIAKIYMANVDLAVVSACKSAISEVDDKGIGGLMWAFKTAGVNSLVMTTDDVVDFVSGEVWRVFFRNIVNGMSKRESLLDAIRQIKTINGGFYSSPKYWSPFILIDGLD